ncbi:hypothetical protein EBT31_03490 [bacterium]|nr:hypothetical protein [bacterium]
MPIIAAEGSLSSQGYGQFAKTGVATYIEDVFSTYLYTGTGANQTFNNGVDLSTKGGMVWIKQRSSPAEDWRCVDSARGITNGLQQNLTNAQQDWTGLGYVTSFNTNGFSIGTNVSINTSAYTYASWTFRKQPKFFDVVTYTGNGLTGKVINHSLGSTPGCIIFKRTDSTSDWAVYHRSLNGGVGPEDYRVFLNTTAAQTSGPSYTVSSVSSTSFTLGSDGAGGGSTLTNVNGATYVAYLFAHNAGGFGLTGTDNVISCGSYTSSYPSKPSINLGWEPQFVLIKAATQSGAGSGPTNWVMFDNMRGVPTGGNDATLLANTSGAEFTNTPYIDFNATGFTVDPNGNGYNDVNYPANNTYIYIAIRRGPMKTPTSGTSVFSPVARSGTSANTTVAGSSGVSDLAIIKNRNTVITQTPFWAARITYNNFLLSSATDAQSGAGTAALQSNPWDVMSGVKVGTGGAVTVTNASGQEYINYLFTRAPGFFDVVCYTGTGSATTVTHNLGVAPELMIVKQRNVARSWVVGNTPNGWTNRLLLDQTVASSAQTSTWNDTAPTSSVFTVGTSSGVNLSGGTYVAYLFASCPGVSKVGSYTGTGALQTINCGFTSGARFVLIKRTDSTGDWYVYDSARGITSGNDPYIFLNDTAAEVTGTNYVDTDTTGFKVTAAAPAGLNANGGTFIFLAVS